MNFALRKQAVLGHATTNSRINSTPFDVYQVGLFNLISKKFHQANPARTKNKVLFSEILLHGKQKLVLTKFALPVTEHLLSIFASIEQFIRAGDCSNEKANGHPTPINSLFSSFSIPIDCFFASNSLFVASLDVFPKEKKALISIRDHKGHEVFQINQNTPISLTQIKGDLGYTPPEPICSVLPPSSSSIRPLTESEVQRLNKRIDDENQKKIESVRTKLYSVIPTSALVEPNVSSEDIVQPSSEPKAVDGPIAQQVWDSDYRIEDHWR